MRCKLARWLSQRRCVALAPENVRARVQSKAVEQARRCSFRRPTRPALPLSARRPFSCSPPPTRATPPASSPMFRRFSQQSQSSSRPGPGQQQQQPPPAGAKPASRHSSSASSSSPAQHQPAVPDLSALSLGSTPLAPAPPYEAIPSSTSSTTGAAPPPAPPPSSRPAQGARAPQRRSSIEDRLAPLGKYDLVLVVDGASVVLLLRASPSRVSRQLRLLAGEAARTDSPSMVDHWKQVGEALMGVVESWCVPLLLLLSRSPLVQRADSPPPAPLARAAQSTTRTASTSYSSTTTPRASSTSSTRPSSSARSARSSRSGARRASSLLLAPRPASRVSARATRLTG